MHGNKHSAFDSVRRIYPVSRETFERLELFVDRLQTWQKKTNLIAPSTMDEIWTRHVSDSIQCLAIKPDASRWVDIGSGGGFPGLVIAAVLVEQEDASITLVESNQKKCAFLRQVIRQMGSEARVVSSRIEVAARDIETPQVVTARALAELPLLLELSAPWLSDGAVGLFHKGREYRQEVAKCNGTWSFDLVEHESRVSPDSVLLEVRNLKPETKQR